MSTGIVIDCLCKESKQITEDHKREFFFNYLETLVENIFLKFL